MDNNEFWNAPDRLLQESQIVIDRPKGSTHPRFPHVCYPMNYGYLAGTASMDGDGTDLWRGSLQTQTADAVICTVDLMKRDSEIKLMLGCTEEEKRIILDFQNDSPYMKGILIQRNER